MDKVSNYLIYKRSLKYNYILLFDEGKYYEVIDRLSKYTQRFLIIDYCDLLGEDFALFIKIDFNKINDIEGIIPQIVSGTVQDNDEHLNSSYDYAVILSVSIITDEYARFYEYGNLDKLLSTSYYVKRIEIINNNFICVFSNRKGKREFIHKEKKDIVFVSIGIGDFALVYNIIIPFLKSDDIEYIVINQYYGNTANNIEDLFGLFGIDKRIIKLEYPSFQYMYDYAVQSGDFKYCYQINVMEGNFSGQLLSKFMNNYLHYKDYIVKTLYPINLKKKNYNIDNFLTRVYEKLDYNDKTIILQLTNSVKKKIGLQFSSSSDEHTNRCRSWYNEEVKLFCKLASQEYDVINLTPYPKNIYDSSNFIDASGLTMLGMLYLISKLNYVVGIDSCCGHIASMLFIPNITLWTLDVPIDCRKQKICWRTSNMNLSLVTNKGFISHQTVWQVLQDINAKRIILEKDIDIINTLEGINIIYLD